VGNLPSALAHANRVLPFLTAQTLAGCDEPTRVYLHCYQVLHACGDPRAGLLLDDAQRYLQQRAALLDVDTRARYLTAVPDNRQLVEIFREQGIGDWCSVTGERSQSPVTDHQSPTPNSHARATLIVTSSLPKAKRSLAPLADAPRRRSTVSVSSLT
jgi:hypothetical protein